MASENEIVLEDLSKNGVLLGMDEKMEPKMAQKMEPKMITKIEHLVIPGGGISGLICYGALKEAQQNGIWDISNIKSIYGTSAGALFAVILSLKYEWKILDDYFIRRPWHNICDFNMYSIIGSFQKRGIFDIHLVRGILQPLFGGMDIPLSITMAEFYEKTQIEIHLYTSLMNFSSSTTNVQELSLVDISYKTHPEWTVIDAVYASCALPIFMSPLEKNGDYYVDGGVFLNYPLGPCVLQENVDPKSILGFRKMTDRQDTLSEESTLFDYILILFNRIFRFILSKNEIHKIDHEIAIKTPPVSIYDLYKMASNETARIEWIQTGVNAAKDFIAKQFV